jgi:hypothetical protein
MKFMNVMKKYGTKIALATTGLSFSALSFATGLLNGTTDPVTEKAVDVQADIAIVAGVLLALAVTIFGVRKVIGTIRG